MRFESGALDDQQRSPLLQFYLSALGFGGVHSPWRETVRLLMIAIAAFGVWTLIRFLKVADERQRRTNFRALRFAFVAGLVLSSLAASCRDSAFFMFPGLVCWGCNSSRGVSA